MNEEAWNDALSLFKKGGYKGDINDFKDLLKSNDEALSDAHKIFTQGGYNGSVDDFSNLLGIKKKGKSESQSQPNQKQSSSDTKEMAQEEASVSSTSQNNRTPSFAAYTPPSLGGDTFPGVAYKIAEEETMSARGQGVYSMDNAKDYLEDKNRKDLKSNTNLITSEDNLPDYKDFIPKDNIPESSTIETPPTEEIQEKRLEDYKTKVPYIENLGGELEYLSKKPEIKSVEGDYQNLEMASINLGLLNQKFDSMPKDEDGNIIATTQEEAKERKVLLGRMESLRDKINSYERNEEGQIIAKTEEESKRIQSEIDAYQTASKEYEALQSSISENFNREKSQLEKLQGEVSDYESKYIESSKRPEYIEFNEKLNEYIQRSADLKLEQLKDQSQWKKDAMKAETDLFGDIGVPDWVETGFISLGGAIAALPEFIENLPAYVENQIYNASRNPQQLINIGSSIQAPTYDFYKADVEEGSYTPVFNFSTNELGDVGRSLFQHVGMRTYAEKIRAGVTDEQIQDGWIETFSKGDTKAASKILFEDFSSGLFDIALAIALPEYAIPLISAKAGMQTYADAVSDPTLSISDAMTMGLVSAVSEATLEKVFDFNIKQGKAIKESLKRGGLDITSEESIKKFKSNIFSNATKKLPQSFISFSEGLVQGSLSELSSIITEKEVRGEAIVLTKEDWNRVYEGGILEGLTGTVPSGVIGGIKYTSKALAWYATKSNARFTQKKYRQQRSDLDRELNEINRAIAEAQDPEEIAALKGTKQDKINQIAELENKQVSELENYSEEDQREIIRLNREARDLLNKSEGATTEKGREALREKARKKIDEVDDIEAKYDSAKERAKNIDIKFYKPEVEKDSNGRAKINESKNDSDTFTIGNVQKTEKVDKNNASLLNKIFNVVSNISKGANVVVHHNIESLLNSNSDALQLYADGKGVPKAYYNKSDNTFHVMSIDAYNKYNDATGTKLEGAKQYMHEMVHPILDKMIETDSAVKDRLYKEIESLSNSGNEVAKRAIGFGKKYDSSKQKKESIVEFFALMGDSKRVKSLDTNALQKLKNILNELLVRAGFKDIKLDTAEDLSTMARNLHTAMKTGSAIDIKGQESSQEGGKDSNQKNSKPNAVESSLDEEFAVSDVANTNLESKGKPNLNDVSFSLDDKVKRHNPKGKIVRGKLKDFAGNKMHVTFSDRMVGGYVDGREYKGGVYFPVITNSFWGANSVGASNKIIKATVKNADGFRYMVIGMMNPDSHMSNLDMSTKALKELESELNSSRVTVEEGYKRIIKAFDKKALKEKFGETVEKYKGKRQTKANLINLIDETVLSSDSTFDLRRSFLETVLGKADKNIKLRFGKLPSYSTLAQILAEPVTRGMDAGDTSFIVRTKGNLSVAEPKKGDPDYHPSYKYIVRSTEDVDLVFLDGIYNVVDMFPRIEAKNLGHKEYQDKYGDNWRTRYLMYMGLGKMSTTVSDEMVEVDAKADVDFSIDEEASKEKEEARANMMENVEAIIKKIKAKVSDKANPKDVAERVSEAVVAYVQGSKWYTDMANDSEREQTVIEVTKKSGKKVETSPSTRKIFGKKKSPDSGLTEEQVAQERMKALVEGAKGAEKELTEKNDEERKRDKRILKATIKSFKTLIDIERKWFKGDAREKAKAVRDVSKRVKGIIDEFYKKGSINAKQAAVLAKKALSLNAKSKEGAFDNFMDYAEKVFNDAEYGEKVTKASKGLAEINRRRKAKNMPVNVRRAFDNINRINIKDVDINELLAFIDESLNKLRKASEAKDVGRDSELLSDLKSSIDNFVAQTNMAKLERIAKREGKTVEEIIAEAKKGVKKLNKDFEKYLEDNDIDKNNKQEVDDAWGEFLKEKDKKDKEDFEEYAEKVSEVYEGVEVTATDGTVHNINDLNLKDFPKKMIQQLEYLLSIYLKDGKSGGLVSLVETMAAKQKASDIKDGYKFKRNLGMSSIFGVNVKKQKIRKITSGLGTIPAALYYITGDKNAAAKLLAGMGITRFEQAITAHRQDVLDMKEYVGQFLKDVLKDTGVNLKLSKHQVRVAYQSWLEQPPRSVVEGKTTIEEYKKMLLQMVKNGAEYAERNSDRLAWKELAEDLEGKKDIELSKEEQLLLDFMKNLHAEHESEFAQSELDVFNNEFIKEDNYASKNIISFGHSTNESSAELNKFGEKWKSLLNNIYPRTSSNAKPRNKDVYDASNKMISSTWILDQEASWADANKTIKVSAPMKYIGSFLNSKDYTDKFSKDIEGKQDMATIFKMVSGMVNFDQEVARANREANPVLKETVNKTNILRSLSVVASLGSLTQLVKQTPVAVNTVVKLAISGNPNLLIGFVQDLSLIGKRLKYNPLIQKNSIAIRDIEQTLLSSSKAKKEGLVESGLIGKAQNYGERVKKASLYTLKETDALVAKASFLAFYREYVSKNRPDRDINAKDFWETEAQINDLEAVAYATSEVERDHNVSLKEKGNIFVKDQNMLSRLILNTVLPFAGFAMNKKQTIYDDIRRGKDALKNIKDPSSKAEIKEVAVNLIGHLSEGSLYAAAIAYAVPIFKSVLGDLFLSLLGEDDELEIYKDKIAQDDLNDKRFWSAFVSSTLPIAIGASEDNVLELGNYLTYLAVKNNKWESFEEYKRINGGIFYVYNSKNKGTLDYAGLNGIFLSRASDVVSKLISSSNKEIETSNGNKRYLTSKETNLLRSTSALEALSLINIFPGAADFSTMNREVSKTLKLMSSNKQVGAWLREAIQENFYKGDKEGSKEFMDELLKIIKEDYLAKNKLGSLDRDLTNSVTDIISREGFKTLDKNKKAYFDGVERMPDSRTKAKALLEKQVKLQEKEGRDGKLENDILVEYIVYKSLKQQSSSSVIENYYYQKDLWEQNPKKQ